MTLKHILNIYIYIYTIYTYIHTVKPVFNGPFIKRNFVLKGNIFRSRDYHSIPWLNGNLASAEKCSGPLRFRLRQVLLYILVRICTYIFFNFDCIIAAIQ
jgi:hypothetical protein